MKLITSFGLLFLLSNGAFGEETIKVTIGTQSYHCDLGAELKCVSVNEVQRKTIQLKKNDGSAGVEDKPRGLSVDVLTSLNKGQIVYDLTICSSQSCSISTVTTDSSGSIDQMVSGQYNITQKSFDVIGFFITTNTGLSHDLEGGILSRIRRFK
jgi:hypothetical protein